jgi:catechol 2,3-dioxygenase-like lactoylglutathione lyase family enzyme
MTSDTLAAMKIGSHTRTVTVFVTGLLVGVAAMAVVAQSNRIETNMGINHVGITVENMQEAIDAYNKAFGFGEAAVLRDDKGQATLAFIHVSRNTFIELAPASATNRPGLSHFGLQVSDIKAATAGLQQRGIKIDNPRPGRTVSLINATTEPVGVRMELSELGPESMLGKSIAAFK